MTTPSVLAPSAAPRQSYDITRALLNGSRVMEPVALVGIRGYYRDTMGEPGKNDRGIYDDAIFLVDHNCQLTFNANTDPSVFRPGIAVLKPGLWKYRVGIHGLSKPESQRYEALVQAGEVTVVRDREGEETGWFGINIHRGGESGTSSLGCQTIVPKQWEVFIASVKGALKRANQTIIPYLLAENL